jgi:Bor protein
MSSSRAVAVHAVKTLLGIAGCVAATSCYSTVVKSGAPAAPAAIEYDDKWHSGLIVGIAELSGPYDLSRICPNGWAEIKTETSFVNGLVQVLTWNIYNPQTVTVRCAAGAPPPNVSGNAPPASPPMVGAPPAPSPAPPPIAPAPAH